jgi:hypothetical protein
MPSLHAAPDRFSLCPAHFTIRLAAVEAAFPLPGNGLSRPFADRRCRHLGSSGRVWPLIVPHQNPKSRTRAHRPRSRSYRDPDESDSPETQRNAELVAQTGASCSMQLAARAIGVCEYGKVRRI